MPQNNHTNESDAVKKRAFAGKLTPRKKLTPEAAAAELAKIALNKRAESSVLIFHPKDKGRSSLTNISEDEKEHPGKII